MAEHELFTVNASVLVAIGSILCISKKTMPVGVGIMAAGITNGIVALLCLLLGV